MLAIGDGRNVKYPTVSHDLVLLLKGTYKKGGSLGMKGLTLA